MRPTTTGPRGLLAALTPTGRSAALATDGGGSRHGTDGGGSNKRHLVVIEAVAATQAALVRDNDLPTVAPANAARAEERGEPQSNRERLDPALRIDMARSALLGRVSFAINGGWRELRNGALALWKATLPEDGLLQAQAGAVLQVAPKRKERICEIYVQMDDLWPFWESITRIDPVMTPRTMELLHAVLQFANSLVMPMKTAIDARRPSEMDPRVMPMIDVPAHGSLPSGHATAAYVLSGVLCRLLNLASPDGQDPAAPLTCRLMSRLAFRVAQNREIAGVHYPIDSAAGRLLGTVLANHLARAAGFAEAPLAATVDLASLDAAQASALDTVTDDLGSVLSVPNGVFMLDGMAGPPDVVQDFKYLWDMAERELISRRLRYPR